MPFQPHMIWIIIPRFAEEMLVSKQQKKESSGEFFCRESTQWKSLPRDSPHVRSSLRLWSRIQPCSTSHCTRWDRFSHWIYKIPKLSSLINLPVVISQLGRVSNTIWRIFFRQRGNPFPHFLLSFCRTHQDETATRTMNRQLAPASSRSTPSLAFRREFPDSSPNCPSSAELWTISRKSLMASYKFRTVETVSYVISVWNIRTILFTCSQSSGLNATYVLSFRYQ